MSHEFQVQCRGLPWETTESELRNFFGNSDIASVDIPRRNGRASGDATVTFNSEAGYKEALKKDREHLGSRYIEVFSMDSAPRRRGGDDFRGSRGGPPRDRFNDRRSGGGGGASGPDSVVRLRGLPFSVTVRDITDFLAPLPIVRDGVLLPDQQRARPGGEAYVCFETMESVQIAKQRHMKNIGHRYIEVFESSFRDLSRFADDNNLRVPRFGPQPFVSGPPRGAYDPYADGGYRREPARAPEDPYRREYSQRPYDGGYQSAPAPAPAQPAQNPYSPAAPQGPGAGYGYDAYQPKPYEYGRSEPRDPAPAHRDREMGRGGDPRGGAPVDPYTGQERYSEYGGSSAPVGGGSSGGGGANGYDYWRGGSAVGGGAGGGGAPPSRDPYLGDSWASGGGSGGGGAPQDRDRYGGGGYPSEPYQQREAGGAMRRPDYGRPDDRHPPRQEPYGYSRDRPDYGRSAGPPPPQQAPGQQFILRMRGIPFRATEADVYDFFHPARPNQVEMLKDAYQRMSGDARVVFYNRKDYDDALMKDKQYMGERYIEIIPDNGRY